MTPVWSQTAAYLQLALSIDRHLPGFVDAYFGPVEHRRAVGERAKPPLEELAAVAAGLREEVSTNRSLEPARREYLAAQLLAMETVLEILAGEPLSIVEETQRVYGVTPSWTDESVFLEAHRELGEIVPGDGSLAARCEAYERQMRVAVGEALPVIRWLATKLQGRARSEFPLPAGEKCEFRFVRGKPWYAFNHYRGRYTSRIELNVDVPVNIVWLPLTLAHEAYPGHHTESTIKEHRLVRDLGRMEHAIQIENSPSAVISEGIANAALDVLLPPDDLVEVYASLLRRCRMSPGEGRRAAAYMKAQRPLGRVRPNCILLAYQGHRLDAELLAYSKRYALLPENEAQMSLRYIKDPLRRSYGFIYPLGGDLVRRFVFGGADPLRRFARLLEVPATPDQVVGWIEARAPEA